VQYAFLSDLHGRIVKMQAVLADAQQRGAAQIVCLGDVGGDERPGLSGRERAVRCQALTQP
jgi:predicted phosphodiesterase